jgi:hypothetical protein
VSGFWLLALATHGQAAFAQRWLPTTAQWFVKSSVMAILALVQ